MSLTVAVHFAMLPKFGADRLESNLFSPGNLCWRIPHEVMDAGGSEKAGLGTMRV